MKNVLKEYCENYIKLEEIKKKIQVNNYSKKIHKELFLNIHNVKGICTALGRENLAYELHRFEDFLSKNNSLDEEVCREIAVQLERLTFRAKRYLSQEDIDLRAYFKLLARNIGRITNKEVKIRLRIEGGELSRKEKHILRELISPLVINSIDHGIETQSVRKRKGKNEEGLIKVNISQDVKKIYVKVEDDGCGITDKNNKQKEKTVAIVSGRDMGLRFVTWQVSEMFGDFNIDYKKGQGAEAKFHFERPFEYVKFVA